MNDPTIPAMTKVGDPIVANLPVAPAGEHEPTSRRAAQVTSRAIWWGELGVLLALLLVHLPRQYGALRREVPPDLIEQLGSEELLSLSLRVGTLLGALVYPVLFAALLGIASLLERHVLDTPIALPRGLRIGAFHTVVVLCVILPVIFMVTTGRTERVAGPPLGGYLAGAIVIVLWIFRPALRELPGPRQVLAVAAITIVAVLVTL